MLVALYMYHHLAPITPTGQQTTLVAIAKNTAEIIGWYEQFMTDPYEEDGPTLDHGGNIKYTKHFIKGSPLEWYKPLEDYEMEKRKGGAGLFEIPSFEEFQDNINSGYQSEMASLQVRTQAQIDHYRNNIEPKMVSYAAAPRRTVQ